MTTDDILRMAREAGWSDLALSMIKGGEDEKRLERFFRLAYAAGAAAEREQCAKVCKDEMIDEEQFNDDVAYNAGCHDCAAAIRARGKT